MTITSPKRLVVPLITTVMLAVVACFAAPVPKETVDPRKGSESAEPAEPAIDPDKLKDDVALRVKDAAARTTSSNNLKQIALAFHSHNDAMRMMPADVVGKDGKPILSWRVLILPYIEQMPLYKQFKLDEPWNSEHNIQLLEKMPKLFDSPRVALRRKGYTVYQTFTGPNTLYPPGGRAPRIPGSFPDGTSNTIMVVESSMAVPWTKPADTAVDLKKELPDFGKAFGQKPLVALGDGSVRALDLKKLSVETLKRAIDPADGMPLGSDW